MQKKLRSIDSFVFFKALRNIATHRSVLSGIKGKFDRPVARLVSVSVGGTVPFSEQLFLVPEKLEAIFSNILQDRPHEPRNIEVAMRHLEALKEGEGDIMLVEVIDAAIAEVTPHVV